MATGFLVGQVVVTDPSVGTAGGYQLVAASPCVSAADCEQLESMPQISDFLHLEETPGSYVSFYRLGSGNWAFGRRFARGKRRREAFNRIVTWTLVVPEPLLEALAWEPWLLTTCRFRPADGAGSLTYRQLTEQETDRAALDLAAEAPDAPEAQRLAFLAPRVEFLRERWGQEDLKKALGRALGVFENGGRLLLPQGAESEQLAALAWSALPRRDRRAIAWTTHLAPGSGGVFQLANIPAPEEARHAPGGERTWTLLGEVAAGSGSMALAKVLADGKPPFSQVSRGWYETDCRLAENGERVRRWVLYVQGGGAPYDGFPSRDALEAYLNIHANDATAAKDPWRGPGELLRLCAMTVRNLVLSQRSRDRAADEVYRLLKPRGLSEAVLQPELVYNLANEERDGEVILGALAMALKAASYAPEAARALLAATEPLKRRGDRTLLAHVAAEFVVPRLGGSPLPPLAVLLRDHLDLFLDSLSAVPAGMAAALRDWRDELFDRVAQELADWAEHDPKAAREVAREVAAGNAELPAQGSLQGISGRLAAAKVPFANRFPFVLAEATFLDREELPVDSAELRVSLEKLDTDQCRALASKLCRQLRKAPRLGPAHRELVSRMAGALTLCPDETVAALALDRDDLSVAEFLAWKEPIVEVAAACRNQGHLKSSSALCANWCLQGKRFGGPEVSHEVAVLFRSLLKEDAARVAHAWAPPRRGQNISDIARQWIFSIKLRMANGSRLENEIVQLADEVRTDSLSLKDFVTICDEVLPADSVDRLRALLGLLLSPRLYLSIRRELRERLLAHALKNVGARLSQVLPPTGGIAWLARDGVVLLRIARALGESWADARYDCWDFLWEAVELERYDAVGALLRGTDRLAGEDFLAALAARNGGRPALILDLARAARHEIHGWDLVTFRPRLDRLYPAEESR